MLRLTSPDTVPPGEFPYVVKETGFAVHGHTLQQAYEKARDNLKANGFQVPPALKAIIEDDVCRKLGHPICQEDDPTKRFLNTLQLDWAILKAGTTALGSWVLAGKPKVAQEQAEARADVCAKCPANVSPDGCSHCQMGALANLIHSIVGSSRTSNSDGLRACSCCGCGLQVKVFIPLEHITKTEPLIAYPEHCWIRKEKAHASND